MVVVVDLFFSSLLPGRCSLSRTQENRVIKREESDKNLQLKEVRWSVFLLKWKASS